MIYVYAIGEHRGRLTAFVRRGVSGTGEPDPEALVEHDRVVFSLMEHGPVLPMRFGTVVPGEREIRSLLTEHRKELRRTLDHVRRRVEFGVRGWSRAASSGSEYMRAKLDATKALEELAADSHARAKDTAYLVDRDLAKSFEARVRDLGLVLSGPWPPYSFTGALDG